MKASGLFVGCLEEGGIEYIFGVPGVTNLIVGVVDSNMDRSPMLALIGQGSTTRLHKKSHQIMDVVGMFEPVTKWATTLLNADTLFEIARKAAHLARNEKPGAVLINLPAGSFAADQSEKDGVVFAKL